MDPTVGGVGVHLSGTWGFKGGTRKDGSTARIDQRMAGNGGLRRCMPPASKGGKPGEVARGRFTGSRASTWPPKSIPRSNYARVALGSDGDDKRLPGQSKRAGVLWRAAAGAAQCAVGGKDTMESRQGGRDGSAARH